MLEPDQWKALQRLPRKSQRETALDFLENYLPHTPKTWRPDGKLKQLKGEHAGLWQFDIDRQYRIVYAVDQQVRQVNVEYLGFHPDWGARSRRGRVRR